MGKRLYPCKVKAGPMAGATYYVERRTDWGDTRVSVDAGTTGWHKSSKAAREAAEAKGWVWVLDKADKPVLVHSSVAYLYRPVPAATLEIAA